MTDDVDPPGPDQLAARWSALHHQIDPAGVPVLKGWLRLMWAGGRVLARAGVPPTAVTCAGVALAGSSVALARTRPVLAGVAVVGAAVCDGLDGATAVVGDRATRSGRIADAVADRVCDGAFAAVLWRRGAPAWAAASAAGSAWGVDTLRRVRHVPSRITVAERPTFTVCAMLACESVVLTRRGWPARLSAAVWIGAGAVGVVQLLRTPTPDGQALGGPDRGGDVAPGQRDQG
ncbi:CDP-alcohol phosphatidyltransferase family protein [uncultured Jatrophihabitans sp.]|uniref:CDP-alcohol phosphatidyltransferase family protein n=1 Tax=uncultured Jatrophihabitans sp. TaxID=1610747 RepID=UPI0035CBC4B0